ncbi:hypothetical protein [Borreliella lusitaniae]|uniref:Uncharacterized protein n=1 Tax=Borreliella lusitaniae TaxID=100177 RepID=A0ABZ0CQN0_9SPIR|nr:hypothetical protein [Borreliella lusitaniae]WKC84908.1 hypothetical protein QIA24_00465 [Borreliella lusitaniae]WNY69133.1 hypothetical protein QIA44_04710 [Borreliella lusitaniae]
MFKIKYILLSALILSCSVNGDQFTQQQESKIREIVATEQTKTLESLIEAAGKSIANESLLDVIIKGKNKIVSGAHKTEEFLKGVKDAIMPSKPNTPTP